MKCPYCVRDIDDQAIVCIHCSRDLFFLRPLLERVGALEARVAKAEASVAQLASAQPPVASEREDAPPVAPEGTFHAVYLAIVIVAGFLGTASYAYFKLGNGGPMFLWASMIVPLPAGLILGVWWPGRHLLGYAWGGLLLGAVNLAALLLTPGSLGSGWRTEVIVYVLAVALLFVSGGALGDWIESRFRPNPGPSPFALRFAARFVPADAGAAGASRTKQIAELITALSPILPIVGSLIGVWAQYVSKR